MMSFIPYSVLLIALALLFIAVPYLRFRPSDNSIDPEIRRRKNREVYESSLAELEKDQAEGVISVDEFEKLKTELSRSFLRDMDAI
ncbi:MAG: c-type cytochrome biogenesis protein CcmI, partial [Gammaproteobacteria bacterium]